MSLTNAVVDDRLDVAAVRRDFPILAETIFGHPLAYLDNGASTQKPACVIEAIDNFYRHDYANVHRGIHTLSQRATDQFEAARVTAGRFINAASHEEIVFTRGTTEAINLVAYTLGRQRLKAGDEVLISALEHHSNIVPWQILCESTGARLNVIPMADDGEVIMDEFHALLSDRTRIVAVTHVSNALGTVLPLPEIIAAAHARGAVVLVDGAQAVAHQAVDVQALDCDFYAFSGHKIFGPTGIGVLYGRREQLEAMPPFLGGGDMIETVSFERTEYAAVPYKFEAGTPNIAGAIGLGVALDYASAIGLERIAAHEEQVLDYATEQVRRIDGLQVLGTAAHKAGILSFVIDGLHAADIGTLLDHQGVAIRVGHHCAMPVMQRLGVDATCRASLAMYNSEQDIDALVSALHKAVDMLR